MKKRVLVTGSNGVVGELLMSAWRESEEFESIGLSRSAGPHTDIVADMSDMAALESAMQGVHAVVHMAASSAVESPWDDVLQHNLIGTYNVIEAARRAGVEQFVFASSNHAVGTYEMEHTPEVFELDFGTTWDHEAELRPDSYYGVSKVYGEAMARYYVDHHGMRAACLRIGGVRRPDHPTHPDVLWADPETDDPDILQTRRRMRAVWLSERDCVHLVECSLRTEKPWVLVYGISDNPRKLWDIDHARETIGYSPQDSAPREIRPGDL